MDKETLLSILKEEAIESLSRNDQIASKIPGIEYIKLGAKPGERKFCVASYSRTTDSLLPKTIEVGGVIYRISVISSDLVDDRVHCVPMCTFDEKDD